MLSIDKRYLLPICVIYAAAWFIPISGTSGIKGYEGAILANDMLMDGLAYFTGIGVEKPVYSYVEILKNALNIIAGLPNVLFVLAIAALVMGKAEALYFAAPCLLVMALWGSGTNPLGGYGLWLLAGLGVFVLSVVYFWRKKEMSVGRFLISGPFIVSYCFGLVFLLNGLLDNGA